MSQSFPGLLVAATGSQKAPLSCFYAAPAAKRPFLVNSQDRATPF